MFHRFNFPLDVAATSRHKWEHMKQPKPYLAKARVDCWTLQNLQMIAVREGLDHSDIVRKALREFITRYTAIPSHAG